MALLTALSETLRLGLRCLADQPVRATASGMLSLRMGTHASEAVSALPGQPEEPSESSLTNFRLIPA
jgi:hypothetical protein